MEGTGRRAEGDPPLEPIKLPQESAVAHTRTRMPFNLRGGPHNLPPRSSSPGVKRSASDLEEGVSIRDESQIAPLVPDSPLRVCHEVGPQQTPKAKIKTSPRSVGETTIIRPPIDDQIAQVTASSMKTPIECQKGYLITSDWLNRVRARGSTEEGPSPRLTKGASEGEIGPVDNSSLIDSSEPLSLPRCRPVVAAHQLSPLPADPLTFLQPQPAGTFATKPTNSLSPSDPA